MKKKTRKVCIYGLGGVGGYLGGLLAHRAEQDDVDVYFVARGGHLAAVKEKGLILETPSKGSLVCRPREASETVEGFPVMDWLFLCVKGYDLEAALERVAPIVGEETVIIAPLNGVDIYERIKAKLDRGTVLPSCIFVTAALEAPGLVHHKGGTTLLVVGRDPQKPEAEWEALKHLMEAAEIPCKWMADARPVLWEKYIMFAPFALVTAHTGKTFGQIMEDEEAKALVKAIMEEVVALAAAEGVPVKDGIIETFLGNAGFYPYETKTSYQRDIESGKGKDEGDLIGGTILRLGKVHGISTANAEKVYRAK